MTDDQTARAWQPGQPPIPEMWPAPPPAPPPQKPPTLLPVIVAAVVALVVGAGIGYVLPHSAKTAGKPSPSTSSSSAALIGVNGTLELRGAGMSGVRTTEDGHCTGTGGYSDITEGAQVVISDDTGATLTIVQLGPGTGDLFSCIFAFSANVPAGRGYYGIQVTHRGIVKESEEALRSSVSINLGD